MPFTFQVRLKDYDHPPLILESLEGETFMDLTKRARDELVQAFGFEEGELDGYDTFCRPGGSVFSVRLKVESVLKEGEEILLSQPIKPKPKIVAPTPPAEQKQEKQGAVPLTAAPVTQPTKPLSVPISLSELSIDTRKTNVSLLNEYCLRTFHDSPVYNVGESLSPDEPFVIRISLPQPDTRFIERQYTGTTRRKTAKHHLAGEMLRSLGQPTSTDGVSKPVMALPMNLEADDSNETQRLNEYCGRHFQACPTFEYSPDPIPNSGSYEVVLVMPPDGQRISLVVSNVSKKEARRQVCAKALAQITSGTVQKQQPAVARKAANMSVTAPAFVPAPDPFKAGVVRAPGRPSELVPPRSFGTNSLFDSQPSWFGAGAFRPSTLRAPDKQP